ncbi:MAG: radical SAM protein [bacterium]|nr:radical SAM protein [bacterium]MDD5353924.1 radical SAM protein [bacterium]
MPTPSYLKLQRNGILSERVKQAYRQLSNCNLCPRGCRINRQQEAHGFCQAGLSPEIASYNAHFGEEPSLSGTAGSGTIFFTHCNLGCAFCQNYPISQFGNGTAISVDELARIMLFLQSKKCHNVNLVTGTIYVPQILASLEKAIDQGFHLPLVYNCGGYESLATLKLLDGIIDIYLPDAKYSDNALAEKYSQAPNYWEINQAALLEMHRQVGDLQLDTEGIASQGLLIRHLVLPGNISGSLKILEFIASKISNQTYLSIMSQYTPRHLACGIPELNRKVTREEYGTVIDKLKQLNLHNGWVQEI